MGTVDSYRLSRTVISSASPVQSLLTELFISIDMFLPDNMDSCDSCFPLKSYSEENKTTESGSNNNKNDGGFSNKSSSETSVDTNKSSSTNQTKDANKEYWDYVKFKSAIDC